VKENISFQNRKVQRVVVVLLPTRLDQVLKQQLFQERKRTPIIIQKNFAVEDRSKDKSGYYYSR
jgi:hypothetical protein